MHKKYVFFGYWSEYVLHPLYKQMKEDGYDCIEVTPDTCLNMRHTLWKLKGNDIIFLTSAHLFLDGSYSLYQNVAGAVSALEAIDILRPVQSVFYPHDLGALIHDFDRPWIYSTFDLILYPIDGFSHMSAFGSQVFNVGWIKKTKSLSKGQRFSAFHGFSEEESYYAMGFEAMYDRFSPIWEQGVLVKGGFRFLANEFEQFLKQKGVHVCSILYPLYDLIDENELVLTNALTSVNIESALSGRYTINMLDGLFSHREHQEAFAGFPNLEMLTIPETAERLNAYYAGDFLPPQGEDLLKPFDYKQVLALLEK